MSLGCENHYPFVLNTDKNSGTCDRCRSNFEAIRAFAENEKRTQSVLGNEGSSQDVMPVWKEFSANADESFKVWEEPSVNIGAQPLPSQDSGTFARALPSAAKNLQECGAYRLQDRNEVCLLAAFTLMILYPSAKMFSGGLTK